MDADFIREFTELYEYYLQVQKINLDIDQRLDLAKNIVDPRCDSSELNSHFYKSIENIEQSIADFRSCKHRVEQQLYNQLRDREKQMMQYSYSLYEQNLKNPNDDDYLLSKHNFLSHAVIDFLKSKIQKISSWQYAALDMNPCNGLFTKEMVAYSPLYVLSSREKITDHIKSNFNDYYSNRRLRVYKHIDKLPKQQFGLVININNYDHIPMDPIHDSAKKVFELLRPGGDFIFTYYNCESIKALKNISNGGFKSYNTESLISGMLHGLGFDIVEAVDIEGGSWSVMHAKKPGKLHSNKQSDIIIKVVKVS